MTAFDFPAFSRRNRARCESSRGFKHALNSWSRSEWMVAVMGEVGELSDALVNFARYRADESETASPTRTAELRKALADEVADVFIYLDLAAQAAGVDTHSSPRHVTAMLVAELSALEHVARANGWGSAHWLAPFVAAIGGVCSTVKQINRVRQGIPGNKKGTTIGTLEADFVVGCMRSVCLLEHFANKCGIVFADAIVAKFEETSAKINYVELQS